MSTPYRYPETVLYGVRSCPHCQGFGTLNGVSWEDGGEPCQCIEDQLIGKADFIRLADGEIEVRPWDGA